MDIGYCNCEETQTDEGKRANTTKEQSEEPGGDNTGPSESTDKPERPLDWDARDLEADAWIPKSGRSVEGRYTNRFWEEE